MQKDPRASNIMPIYVGADHRHGALYEDSQTESGDAGIDVEIQYAVRSCQRGGGTTLAQAG